MPLKMETHKKWIKYGFWLLVLAGTYIIMQKVMHPGWTIFGL